MTSHPRRYYTRVSDVRDYEAEVETTGKHTGDDATIVGIVKYLYGNCGVSAPKTNKHAGQPSGGDCRNGANDDMTPAYSERGPGGVERDLELANGSSCWVDERASCNGKH